MVSIFSWRWPLPVICAMCALFAPPSHSADAIPGEELCVAPVEALAFEGNEVTRNEVLLREIAQPVGAPCVLDLVIDSIQNLMDLGLFKQVRARIDQPADAQSGAGPTVVFVVREKYFFLAIPRISRTSDRELRAGVQLRWDNFTGRLHQLKLTSEWRQEDDGRGDSGYVHSLDYVVPRFFNSDYGFAVDLSGIDRETTLSRGETEFGEALEQSHAVGVSLSRWFNRYQGLVGLRVFGGFRYSVRRYAELVGRLGPFVEGRDVVVRVGAETRNVHRDAFRRRGLRYGASVAFSTQATGSDFDYHRADAWARWYHPLPGGLRNLNTQLRVGVSDGAPFGEYAYSIGGGELLRGMDTSSHQGDVMTLLNVEYLSAFFRYPNLRWVGFADLGNVYDKDSVRLFDQRLRGGLGLRWKIQALTNTDLRADVAWDPTESDVRIYASTSLTF